jgi:PAS domain S-box-containing protein
VSGTVYRDGAGRPCRHLGTVVDITALRHAERERRRSDALYRSLMDHAGVGIGLWSPDGVCLMMNRKALATMGTALGEVRGRTLADLFGAERAGVYLARIRGVLATDRAATYDDEVAIHDEPRWYRSTYAPIREATGVAVGVQVIAADISDRERAARELKASLDEKTVLVREVHHRVKNNLQIVCSTLSLRAAFADDDAVRATLHDIEQRVLAIALVHEKLYRTEGFDHVPLDEFVRDLCDHLEDALLDASGRIAFDVRAEPVTAPVDTAVPFGIVVNELVTNALRHGFPERRAGRIAITLSREAGEIVLAVTDDGVGCASGFEPRSAGGIGLRTVVQVVERQLCGRVEFAGDVGVSCRVRFPAELRQSGA